MEKSPNKAYIAWENNEVSLSSNSNNEEQENIMDLCACRYKVENPTEGSYDVLMMTTMNKVYSFQP